MGNCIPGSILCVVIYEIKTYTAAGIIINLYTATYNELHNRNMNSNECHSDTKYRITELNHLVVSNIEYNSMHVYYKIAIS